jgi:hypothetical protein
MESSARAWVCSRSRSSVIAEAALSASGNAASCAEREPAKTTVRTASVTAREGLRGGEP